MKYSIHKLFALVAISLGSLSLSAAELEITADDTMLFNVSELETTAGEETTLVFINQGKLPKAAMGHNFVLLKPGTDIATFGNAAVTAAANEYIPTQPELADKVIAHTKLLGPGEQDSITFTISEPGAYPFLCSFPGHWALMKGVLQVN